MDGAPRRLVDRQEQPGAVVLVLDGGETLEVAPDAVPDDLPGVGESLGSPLLDALRAAAARKAAARDLFALLDRKLWTVARLRRRLIDRGHPEPAVAAVLASATGQGLVSDAAYAEAFCRDALGRKAVGRAWLETRLREKGVDPDLAAATASDQLPADREAELAREAATARWRRERGRDARAEARVGRFLASRGFGPALAWRAVRSARPDDDPPDASCNSDTEGPS
ncbi:hypothetical protein GF314_01275 [bacterium]|nr:hypothetical protein [bacterium]